MEFHQVLEAIIIGGVVGGITSSLIMMAIVHGGGSKGDNVTLVFRQGGSNDESPKD